MRLPVRVLAALAFLYAWPAAWPSAPGQLSTVTATLAQQVAKVWVNTKSGVYHCPGSRYYGSTKAGEFMPEAQARAAGNRPAYSQSCGPSTYANTAGPPQPRRLVSPTAAAAAGAKVWVNTSSSVYHCPGSRYYGNTKAGQFMSEADAQAVGNRPAYGKACS